MYDSRIPIVACYHQFGASLLLHEAYDGTCDNEPALECWTKYLRHTKSLLAHMWDDKTGRTCGRTFYSHGLFELGRNFTVALCPAEWTSANRLAI